MEFAVVVSLIAAALIFDYINGFHDAANSIATVVSTRVLSPGRAVVWARSSTSPRISRSVPPSRRRSAPA